MTTRAERAEDLARRRAIAAAHPSCRFCRRPVVAGQTDPFGVPAHYVCSGAFDMLPADHPARRWTGPPGQAQTSHRGRDDVRPN